MKQGATGFLKIKIDDVIKIDEVNSIIFTVTTPDRDLQFKKSYPDDVAYEDGYYYIPLFQQDTVNMEGVYKIEAQINMKNAEVVKTTINKLFINSSLNTTMLDSNPSFRQIGSLVDMKVEGIAIGRDGKNGATFTPIMTGTVLSWENDKGLENPQPVDLKGEKGDKGDSSKPVGDYAYVTLNLNDYRVARLGGSWNGGSSAGGFCLSCVDWVGARYRTIGGRLVYIPNLKNW